MTAAPPLLRLRDVSRAFELPAPLIARIARRAPRRLIAVDHVGLEVRRGETFGLVGESGCGKSTLARLIVGLHRPSAGAIELDGVPLAPDVRDRPRAVRRRLQMVFQDPYASLNARWRVADIIAEPVETAGEASPGAAARERAGELLATVGLDPAHLDRYPHQFSGGQRQRVAIARALSTHPDLLVCDEPTSALDVSVQAQILNLLKDIQEKAQLGCVLISHNLAVVHHMADTVGVMYLGRLVERAPKRELFARPRHPYTRMLLAALPAMHGRAKTRRAIEGEVPSPIDRPPGCHFHPRCPLAGARCREEAPALRSAADGAAVACHAVEEGRA